MNASELIETISAAAGGAGALVLLGKWMLRQVIEAKGDVARNDIITDLREDIDRLRDNERRMESRIEAMEEKLATLFSKLVTVRGHALFAHQIATKFDPITGEPRQHVIDTLTLIIKDD